jgi:hypothetical protein
LKEAEKKEKAEKKAQEEASKQLANDLQQVARKHTLKKASKG